MGNDMPQKNRNRKFAGLALGATFGIFLVLSGGVGAACAADDEDSMLPDEKFFRSFLRGLGLRNGQEAGIEYKERPPLVVPPSRDLPVPVTAGVPGAGNPAWPVDPDEVKKAADRRARAQRKAYNPETDQNQLMPDQLGVKSDKQTGKSSEGPDHSPELTPNELGYTGKLWKDVFGIFSKDKPAETAKFVREPPRASARVMNDRQTDTVNR
jgi:hypothetical protein